MPTEDAFPTLLGCARLMGDDTLFDVKFFPYQTADNDKVNVFAVVGERDVFICRPRTDQDEPFDVLGWYKDEDPHASYNSLVWTIDTTNGNPLLCIAGSSPKQIKILDVLTARPVRTIPGHGRGINDLAILPGSTHILASASEDYTIRLWDLRPKFASQPCVAMFSGEGHKQPSLSMTFHPNGRWLLTGGLDTAVCLWSVPSAAQLDRSEEQLEQHNEPMVIYYPHFFSTEVHHNYVDCLQFYGDLIISKAARDQTGTPKNEILLWKIDGFDADAPTPSHHPIPTPGVSTRSAFQHESTSRGFQRLLSFEIFHTDRFYHRFGLLHEAGMRPILSMGNQKSNFLFWDLQQLEEGGDPAENKPKQKGKGKKQARKKDNAETLSRLDGLRSESVISDETGGGSTPMPSSTSISATPERKYALSEPFTALKPHATMIPKTKMLRNARGLDEHFATSQMAWSRDGTWLVACGDKGMICVFHRDLGRVNGTPKATNGSDAVPKG